MFTKWDARRNESAFLEIPCPDFQTQMHAPLGYYSGETNLYRYASNNPTNGTDPSGGQALFSNRYPKQVPDQQYAWDNNKASFVGKVFGPITSTADITERFAPGQPFKYVVTASGKVVILDTNIQHVFGTAQEMGQKVGEKVQAAGYASYYYRRGQLILVFDFMTGHYGQSIRANAAAAEDQAKEAFLKIPGKTNNLGRPAISPAKIADVMKFTIPPDYVPLTPKELDRLCRLQLELDKEPAVTHKLRNFLNMTTSEQRVEIFLELARRQREANKQNK